MPRRNRKFILPYTFIFYQSGILLILILGGGALISRLFNPATNRMWQLAVLGYFIWSIVVFALGNMLIRKLRMPWIVALIEVLALMTNLSLDRPYRSAFLMGCSVTVVLASTLYLHRRIYNRGLFQR